MTPEQSEKIAAAVMAELKDIRQIMVARPDADPNTNLLHAILTTMLFIKYTSIGVYTRNR